MIDDSTTHGKIRLEIYKNLTPPTYQMASSYESDPEKLRLFLHELSAWSAAIILTVIKQFVQIDKDAILNEVIESFGSVVGKEKREHTHIIKRLKDKDLQQSIATLFCHHYDEWSSQDFAKEVIKTFVEEVWNDDNESH